MHQSKGRNFRVGALVLATGGLFVCMLLFVIGSSLSSDRVDYFILYEENVKGMVVGSRVNFQGVPVGTVSDIRFQHGNTLVKFTMDPSKATIQDVTRARIDRAIVTGQVTIELEGFSNEGVTMSPGSFIEPAADPFSELMQVGLPGILHSVDELLREGTSLVGRVEGLVSERNLSRVESIVANVDRSLERIPAQVEELIGEVRGRAARIDSLLVQAEGTLAAFEGAATDVRHLAGGDKISTIIDDVRRATAGLDDLIDETRTAVAELRGTVGGARHPLRSALVEGRAALVAVRELARRLGDAPSSILYGVENKEISVPARPPR